MLRLKLTQGPLEPFVLFSFFFVFGRMLVRVLLWLNYISVFEGDMIFDVCWVIGGMVASAYTVYLLKLSRKHPLHWIYWLALISLLFTGSIPIITKWLV